MQRRWSIVGSIIFLVILFASPFPAISPWGLAIPRVLEVGVAQVATEKLQASGARRYAAG
jgi:hypothetical protein